MPRDDHASAGQRDTGPVHEPQFQPQPCKPAILLRWTYDHRAPQGKRVAAPAFFMASPKLISTQYTPSDAPHIRIAYVPSAKEEWAGDWWVVRRQDTGRFLRGKKWFQSQQDAEKFSTAEEAWEAYRRVAKCS